MVDTQNSNSERISLKAGKGKFSNRGSEQYPKFFVYIPKEVAMDTSFPFKHGEDVTVTIAGEKLIITKR